MSMRIPVGKHIHKPAFTAGPPSTGLRDTAIKSEP